MPRRRLRACQRRAAGVVRQPSWNQSFHTCISTIKMAAFVWLDIDLQLIHHLWLLPCAAVGHVIGLYAHDRILKAETPVFFRVLGSVLLVVSSIGMIQVISSA